MGTPEKINTILLNIKTNRPKLVSMCRYKLETYWQNFTEIYLTRVKIRVHQICESWNSLLSLF